MHEPARIPGPQIRSDIQLDIQSDIQSDIHVDLQRCSGAKKSGDPVRYQGVAKMSRDPASTCPAWSNQLLIVRPVDGNRTHATMVTGKHFHHLTNRDSAEHLMIAMVYIMNLSTHSMSSCPQPPPPPLAIFYYTRGPARAAPAGADHTWPRCPPRLSRSVAQPQMQFQVARREQ